MKKHFLLWKCVIGLSFLKPAATRLDFVHTEVLYYAGGGTERKKSCFYVSFVFYLLFRSYVAKDIFFLEPTLMHTSI